MGISEVSIRPYLNPTCGLLAYFNLTFDRKFVVRNLKITEGRHGPTVRMPDTEVEDECPHCRGRNIVRAHFCNWCGKPLAEDRVQYDENGKPRLYIELFHGISAEARAELQKLGRRAYNLSRDSLKRKSACACTKAHSLQDEEPDAAYRFPADYRCMHGIDD